MKFKTSITVPACHLAAWERSSGEILRGVSGYLSRYRRAATRRDRLRQYTERGSACVICNVYWEMEVYNQLHAVASRLRVSVSRLLMEILEFVLHGGETKRVFTSYDCWYVLKGDSRGVFVEIIHYFDRNGQTTEKIT